MKDLILYAGEAPHQVRGILGQCTCLTLRDQKCEPYFEMLLDRQ